MLTELRFSPVENLLVISERHENSFLLWDFRDDRVRQVEGAGGYIHHAWFSPDGRRLATLGLGSGQAVLIWDVASLLARDR